MLVFRLSVFLLLLLVSTCDAEDKESPEFPKSQQGEWLATAIEFNGQSPPNDIVRKFKVTIKAKSIVIGAIEFKDDKFTGEGEPMEFGITHHPSSKPNGIDLTFKNGNEQIRMLGIYAVDGDQLKLCWQHDGKERPTEFKAKAEPSGMMVILKRAK
jgi:uncharacterized protein (TIGR03067 family)